MIFWNKINWDEIVGFEDKGYGILKISCGLSDTPQKDQVEFRMYQDKKDALNFFVSKENLKNLLQQIDKMRADIKKAQE